jgi:vitamin B12 transporter
VPLNPDNDVLLSYSEGFRAPTFNDLYYPDFSTAGPKPETSKSYELQWRSQLSDSTRLKLAVPHRFERRDHLRPGAAERGVRANQWV